MVKLISKKIIILKFEMFISRSAGNKWPVLSAIIHAHEFTSLANAKDSIVDGVSEANRSGTVSRGRLKKIAVQVK